MVGIFKGWKATSGQIQWTWALLPQKSDLRAEKAPGLQVHSGVLTSLAVMSSSAAGPRLPQLRLRGIVSGVTAQPQTWPCHSYLKT